MSDQFVYSHVPVNIISILGVVSNILLLVALLKDPLQCFKNSGTFLVVNLSISDCFSCILSLFYYPIYHGIHDVLTGWNKYLEFLVLWFGLASIVSITSISIDRFLLIVFPIKHHIFVKGKLMATWLALIWIFSCIIPAFRLILARKNNEKLLIYSFGMLAIIISAVLYTFTCCKLKKQSTNIALQNSKENRAQKARILKEKQFLKTIIIIACIAFVCVVPSMVFFQIYHSLSMTIDSEILALGHKLVLFLFYTNFAVNPIIYVIRLQNYRKTFYLLYCRR